MGMQAGHESGLTGDELDLTGYPIAAVDGDIGHVDEATYQVGSSYLVVDTGAWIFGRKVLLPAGVVERRAQGVRRPDQGPDQERTRVRPDRRRTQYPGAARRLLRRDVRRSQTPGCDPAAGGTGVSRLVGPQSSWERDDPKSRVLGSRFLLSRPTGECPSLAAVRIY